jgi:membrane-bound metal-dependent hydrolase YbcI (DUF457 family)
VTNIDKVEHGILGALISLGLYGLYKYTRRENPTIRGALGSVVLGGFAGVLPDLLEPATSPNHRSFFHSSILVSALAYGNQKLWQSRTLTSDQKLAISLFSVAFGSHLVSDSATAKSIPIIF